jgi:hypothetical protein
MSLVVARWSGRGIDVIAAAGIGGCATPPVVRHLSVDHELMTEAGRSEEILSVVIMLHGKYQASNPQKWRELLDRAAELNRKAVGLTLDRLTAVSGSDGGADRFYGGRRGGERGAQGGTRAAAERCGRALPPANQG